MGGWWLVGLVARALARVVSSRTVTTGRVGAVRLSLALLAHLRRRLRLPVARLLLPVRRVPLLCRLLRLLLLPVSGVAGLSSGLLLLCVAASRCSVSRLLRLLLLLLTVGL